MGAFPPLFPFNQSALSPAGSTPRILTAALPSRASSQTAPADERSTRPGSRRIDQSHICLRPASLRRDRASQAGAMQLLVRGDRTWAVEVSEDASVQDLLHAACARDGEL